jgi:glycosyltransferase involved in cell wall biosynthesis
MAQDHYKLAELINAIGVFEPTQRDAPVKASLHARVRIGGSGTFLEQRQRGKTPAAQAYVLNALTNAMSGEADPYRRLLFHNVLLRVDFGYERFLKAAIALRDAPISLVERHASWYTLYVHRFTRMQAFTPSQWLKSGYLLRMLYRQIVAEARAIYGPACEALLPNTSKAGGPPHYAIVLSEFLEENHPLVKQALDLGDALMRHQGAKISLLNASIPPRLPVSYFGDHTLASIVESLSDVSSISYGARQLSFAQNPNMIVNAQSFAWYADQIAQLNPSGVISIGPGNVLTDTLAHAVPTVAFPNIGEVPLSTAPTLCTVAAQTPIEQRLNMRAGTPAINVHHIPTAFRLPASAGPRDRSDFGFPNNARIALVVGMRLETECCERFLAMLNDAAARHSDLHVVFAGPLMQPKTWLSQYPALHKKSALLGFQDDVLAITQACDLFINPLRQGGGTSAIYALSAGLPIISAAQGDVAEIYGREYCALTPDDLPELLNRCLSDDTVSAEMADQACKRWQVKSDMEPMAEAVASLLKKAAYASDTRAISRGKNTQDKAA